LEWEEVELNVHGLSIKTKKISQRHAECLLFILKTPAKTHFNQRVNITPLFSTWATVSGRRILLGIASVNISCQSLAQFLVNLACKLTLSLLQTSKPTFLHHVGECRLMARPVLWRQSVFPYPLPQRASGIAIGKNVDVLITRLSLKNRSDWSSMRLSYRFLYRQR
jgi:hypothetical protein